MGENFEFRDGQERPQPKIRDRGKREVEKKAKALTRLQVEYVALGELRPNSYNPNRQSERDFELLCKSMTEDGFTQPVVALLKDKIIVDGEHRWRAAKKLGYEQIPVVFVDMTPEQMRISTLRHNRARGSEDVELSAELLRDLRELGALSWAQDSLMMDDEEMRILLDDVPVPDELAAEEFSESWGYSQNPSRISTDANEKDVFSGKVVEAQSESMVAFTAEVQGKVEKAQTDEERFELLREYEKNVYRLAISFTGEEAKLVKNILGARPAVRLVELCKKYEDFDFKGAENG